MEGCVILIKLSIAFIVLTVGHESRSQRVNGLKRGEYEVNRQAAYNTRFLQEEQWFKRLRHRTKGSKKSEMPTADQFMSKGIDDMEDVKLTDRKLRNIGSRVQDDVALKITSQSVNLKNEQRLHEVSKKVRRDIKTENQTQQSVECGLASVSCRGCCGNSTDCSHKVAFCRCDPHCAFYDDCCVDYETFCGRKQHISLGVDRQVLACVKPKHVGNTSSAVWMINKCPRNREHDNISRTDCEISDELHVNVTNMRYLIPVLGKNNLIFRNEFCAKCNGIEKFEYFGFSMTCNGVALASNISLAELIEFASRYCKSKAELSIFRDVYQPIRECNQYFRHLCPTLKEMNETCDGYNLGEDDCTSQPIWCTLLNLSKWEDVSDMYDKCKVTSVLLPSDPPEIGKMATVERFGEILKFHHKVQVKLQEQIWPKCLKGQFYDRHLKSCRFGLSMPPVKENIDIFEVVVWIDVGHASDRRLPTLNETVSSLAQLFNFQRSQVSDLRSTTIDGNSTTTLIILFKFSLTNEQTLRLGIHNFTNMNDAVAHFRNDPENSTNGLSLRKLLSFSEKFNITVSNDTFAVFKTTSRQLACIGKQTYSQGNYTSVQNGEYYYINSTGKTFARNQVFFEESLNKSISVCEQIVPSACVGRRINLTSEEYVKFDNLSIFFNRTKTIYDFGEYDIENGKIVMCIPFDPRREIVLKPSNSFVIQTFLTLICLVLSLACLFLVLLTYTIFPELRSLPGKNLLSLAVSLFLAQLLWLIPDSWYTSTPCHVAAVMKHFLFLVSFAAMATIAWHTHSVFASKDVRSRSSSKIRENKRFFKYSAFVWGLPAMFVVACVVVDRTDIYAVYVNEERCWLDNEDAQKNLFVLPVGLLLLYNVILFILTVVRIHHVRSTTSLVRSDQKPRKMFWIYLKISTLMGFTWLFGFIDLAVGTSTVVFSYLFVIFASLQGVYIALAFVMKENVWKKYKKLFARVLRKHKRFKPDYHSTLLEDLSNSRETRV